MKSSVASSLLAISLSMMLSVASSKPQAVIVDQGYIRTPDGSQGTHIGMTSSSLQAKVIDAMFDAVNESAWSGVSVINSTLIRTLDLHGDYIGDTELRLPSLFRLRLHGSITVDPAVSSSTRGTALVRVDGASYVAILGGTFNATGSGGYNAISLLKSTRCVVREIRGTSDLNVIFVNGGSENEIAHNNVGPGTYRCIWTLSTSRALVHSNYAHGCEGHSIDFDAFTAKSVAFNNTCFECGHEGIFVEETATDNVIVANTLSHGSHSGIGVYSLDVGPVKGNTFIGNRVIDNKGTGMVVGGYGHDLKKQSENNLFVDNFISGNTIGVNLHHGQTQGDFWTGNINLDSLVADPSSSDSVAMFDPLSEAGKMSRVKQGTPVLV